MGVDLFPDLSGKYLVCTSSTRPAHLTGLMIYESDTGLTYVSSGTAWIQITANYLICTSVTRPTGRDGLLIYETDTDRYYNYNGSAWIYNSGGTDPTACRMYRSSNQAALTVATATIITFNAETYDYGNCGNTTTGRYTAPEAGLYDYRANISITTAAVSERFLVMGYVNAVEVTRGLDTVIGNASPYSWHIADTLLLAAGDIVDTRVNQVNGTARIVSGSAAGVVSMAIRKAR